MPADTKPFPSTRAMLELAARGLGRIDAQGIRGVTLCSADEIAAMAGALVLFGLVPIPPGGEAPARLVLEAPLEAPLETPVEGDPT